MKMEKRKFRIGTLARHLAVEKFVIRFWEKEFGIRARRSEGGQREYNEKDIKKFESIKELLYEKGYTIAGAKKILKKGGRIDPENSASTHIIASQVTTMESDQERPTLSPELFQQIRELQEKLRKLQELL